MRSAVQIEGVATVSHVVFEGTGGDGVVFELGSGTVDHVTVLGEAAGSIVGGGGYVTNSLVEPPVGGGWTVDAATITTVNKGLLYAQPDWLCPVDGRPAPGGLAWSSTGEHLGGYTGTAGGPGSQPFAGWADEDGDDFGYGLAGTGFDCDDTLSDVNPGADEVCDNVDNDCDGAIDLDLDSGDVGRVDGDGDGWVSETLCFLCPGVALDCLPASKELDCDDSDPLVPLEEDCPPDDTGTLPGDDDDDVTDPGDDDDDAPGDDDDDTTEPRPTADTGRRVAGTATAGCQCGSGGRLLARVLPLVARRR
jgi:hypothetical protein